MVDFGALFTSMIDTIGDVITAFVGALSDNAEAIADVLILGVLMTAAIGLGTRMFRGITSSLQGLIPA